MILNDEWEKFRLRAGPMHRENIIREAYAHMRSARTAYTEAKMWERRAIYTPIITFCVGIVVGVVAL